jgi:hypothetical protein
MVAKFVRIQDDWLVFFPVIGCCVSVLFVERNLPYPHVQDSLLSAKVGVSFTLD